MNFSDKIKICATCQKCKRDINRGVLCSLTNEKPTFEDECENYEPDDAQLRRQEDMEQQADDNFFKDENPRYSLPGSDWFRTLAIFSFINIFLSMLGVVFIISLGSTQMIQALAEGNLMNPIVAFGIMALITAFMFWTWYLAARKCYSYAYTLGILVYAVDVSMVVWMLNLSGDLSILVSLAFNGFVLGALIYKRFTADFRRYQEKFAWGVHKILYTIVAAITALSLAYTIYSVETVVPSEDDSVEVIVEKMQATLPQTLEDDSVWTDAYVEGDAVYFVYKVPSYGSLEYLYEPTDYDKRMMVDALADYAESVGDISLVKIAEEGYSLVLRYCDGCYTVDLNLPNYMLRERL